MCYFRLVNSITNYLNDNVHFFDKASIGRMVARDNALARDEWIFDRTKLLPASKQPMHGLELLIKIFDLLG